MKAVLTEMFKAGHHVEKYFTLEKPIGFPPLVELELDTVCVDYDIYARTVKVCSMLTTGEKNDPVFSTVYDVHEDDPFSTASDQKFLSEAIEMRVKIEEGELDYPDFIDNY